MSVNETAAEALSALLLKRAGHPLSPDRRYRIETTLGPVMRARGFKSVDAMVATAISRKDDQLEIDIVEALLNNETFFFRDRMPFELIERFLNEKLVRSRASRRISIWCAGVSTGQEAYSLAMMLEEQMHRMPGWRIDILGTDISGAAIKRARAGIYTQFEVQRGLPTRQLLNHFEKNGSDWQISAALRGRVQFRNQDITRDQLPVFPLHDIILCRNLLLYLSKDTRRQVFNRLRTALAPDGALVLGAAETILGQTDAFEPDTEYRGLYRPRPVAAAPLTVAGRQADRA